jgi:hypothetical protein
MANIGERIAWAAGFIDGDGFISIEKSGKQGNNGYFRFTSRVEATQGIVEPLLELINLFDGSIHPVKNQYGEYFGWRLRGESVGPVLISLLPYLKVKNRQAEIAIEFSSTVRKLQGKNGRYYPRLDRSIHDRRQALYEECKILNSRKLHAERLSDRASLADDAIVRAVSNNEDTEAAEMSARPMLKAVGF